MTVYYKKYSIWSIDLLVNSTLWDLPNNEIMLALFAIFKVVLLFSNSLLSITPYNQSLLDFLLHAAANKDIICWKLFPPLIEKHGLESNFDLSKPAVMSIIWVYFRPLMDSSLDLGDKEGVFLDSCVSIIVGGGGEERGEVVQQSIMPGSTHCSDIFIESWELLLNAKWNQVWNCS